MTTATTQFEFIVAQDKPTFTTRRVFHAPRSLVWEAWTKPEYVQRWMAPRDLTWTRCEIDLRPGGLYRMVHRGPDGTEYRFHGEYQEVVPEQRLVSSFVFEAMPEYEAIDTTTFDEHDGETTVTTVTVHQTFESRDGHLAGGEMEQGMAEIYDQLDELLEEMKGG